METSRKGLVNVGFEVRCQNDQSRVPLNTLQKIGNFLIGIFIVCISHIRSFSEDGNVRVTDGDREGIFAPDGSWVSGELRECDPQMAVWVTNEPPPQDKTGSSIF